MATTPTRRQFLHTSGLLVATVAAISVDGVEAFLQRPAAAGPYPDPDFLQLDSWIVIRPDNTATFFVGKTDLGQGTGTAFRQIMADELDIDFAKTTCVMGSTDVTVDQGGSGGSDALQTDGYPMRRVAAEARRDPNFLIVARTDSRTTLGLEEAIRRGRMYGDAGADIVFIESPESEDEMRAIGKAISKPLLANMVEGGRTPILPAARLQEIGYAMAIYPAIGFLAAAAALERAYAHLKTAGDSLALGESYGFKKMTELMGFPDVWDFEKKWAVPEKDTAA